MFTITVIHKTDNTSDNEISKQLSLILKNQTKIMATIDELKTKVTDLDAKVDSLQSQVDAEQADIAALLATNATVVSDLNAQIAALQEQIANGATPEQLQEVADGLTAIAAKVDAASADVSSTI